MNATEIDELLEAILADDSEKVLELIDIEVTDENVEDYINENSDIIAKSITTKIEQGDFDYFYSKIYDERFKVTCLNILSHSSKVGYIKATIEKREQLGLPTYMLVNLIKATRDIEYIKSIIDDKEKREEFGLDEYHLNELIKATKDPEYIKSIIDDKEKREELGLNEFYFNELIIDDKEKREELGLGEIYLKELIIATKDPEYIKSIIDDKEKRYEIGVFLLDLKDLIKETKDPEYIKSIIDDKEKREELELDEKGLVDLIKATGDPEYIKGIIEDKEKREELGFDENKLISLILATKDNEYINEFFRYIESKQNTENNSAIVKLPRNMTIGMEIESEGINSESVSDSIVNGWHCKRDASLQEGVEVVSPILHGNTENASEVIRLVCRRLSILRSNCI